MCGLLGATQLFIATTTGAATVAPAAPTTLMAWGNNPNGQIGNGTTLGVQLTPATVGVARWASLSAGFDFSCATRTEGTLWCWGSNDSGQLGIGSSNERHVPTRVGTATNWATVSAGGSHTCAIRKDGTLWCWGSNGSGQLGNNTTRGRFAPVQVGLRLKPWKSVAAGHNYTCALRAATDRDIWCWGANNVGQLGTGNPTPHKLPTSIVRNSGWLSVTAGYGHTCAIYKDGSLWCWGGNGNGELGNNLFEPFGRPGPTPVVGGGTKWSTVTAGDRFTCGIRRDRTLWCWGSNDYAQVGNGSHVSIAAPTSIAGTMKWNKIAAGAMHACGIRITKALWCWGANNFGKLGDGTTIERETPQRIGTLTNWQNVSAGGIHTVANHT